TVPDIFSNVLKSEPDWKILPQRTPHSVHSFLRRCLQKDPARRLRDAADAGIEIDQALVDFDSQAEVTLAFVARSRRGRLDWLFACVTIIALAASFLYRPSAPPETRVQVVTPPTADLTSVSTSPDGRELVFTGLNQNRTQLFLRSFDSGSERVLAGTEGAEF